MISQAHKESNEELNFEFTQGVSQTPALSALANIIRYAPTGPRDKACCLRTRECHSYLLDIVHESFDLIN